MLDFKRGVALGGPGLHALGNLRAQCIGRGAARHAHVGRDFQLAIALADQRRRDRQRPHEVVAIAHIEFFAKISGAVEVGQIARGTRVLVVRERHARCLQEHRQARHGVHTFLGARAVRRRTGDLHVDGVAAARDIDRELALRGVLGNESGASLLQRRRHGIQVTAGDACGGGLRNGVRRCGACHRDDGRLLAVGGLVGKAYRQRAGAFFGHHCRVLAVEHDVEFGQGGLVAVVLHAVATGFLGGLDHQADRACQRYAAFTHRLHRVERRGDGPLVIDRAPAIEVVAHARDLERIKLRAVVEHPFVGHDGNHIGVRENAKGFLALARQRHFEYAVIDIAELQAEVFGHAFHELAEINDRGVFVLRHLVVAHGAQRDHFADGVEHGLLVVHAVVDAEQAADVGQIGALERLLRAVGAHRGSKLWVGLDGGIEERIEARGWRCTGAGHELVEFGLGQRGGHCAAWGDGEQRDCQQGCRGQSNGQACHGFLSLHGSCVPA